MSVIERDRILFSSVWKKARQAKSEGTDFNIAYGLLLNGGAARGQ